VSDSRYEEASRGSSEAYIEGSSSFNQGCYIEKRSLGFIRRDAEHVIVSAFVLDSSSGLVALLGH
jgi:hypothetical protein